MLYIPKGETVSNETLYQCYRANPHGMGLMFSFNGELRTYKSMNFKTFKREFNTLRKIYPLSNFCLHFRIATSGDIDLPNQHPFYIGPSLAMMHNGILHGYGYADINDTRDFITSELSPLYVRYSPSFFFRDAVIRDLGKHIGRYNKFLLMRETGEVAIINEDSGYWIGGIWFSNLDFMPRNYAPLLDLQETGV